MTKVTPDPTVEERTEFPVSQNRDLDILFVIDNSGSMKAEQDSLALNFERIANALEGLEDGLPNIHIGVVSTDVGAGGFACGAPEGDDGALQAIPRVSGCEPPSGSFIQNVEGSANYSGSLSDAFSCIARLGKDGCGFEQPLEAMKRALDGSNPDNLGFLRESARLAVIFITDEDDCSVFDPTMFARAGEPGEDLGAQKSFRCFEYGVTCDGEIDPRLTGPRSGCQPRNDSPYMPEVQEYVTFLKALKQYESQLLVAGIVGPREPVAVEPDAQGDACLAYSCGDVPVCGDAAEDEPAAVPPIRLQAFIESFQLNHTSTICDEDLSAAVQSIADWLGDGLDGRCLQGRVQDTDEATPGVQPDCSVVEVRRPNTDEQSERTLPTCGDSGDMPCYTLEANPEACDGTEQHLRVEVFYEGDEVVPPDTVIRAYCVGG